MSRVIQSKFTPGKHTWVFSERKTFTANLNRCTETGDVQIITNLPMRDEDVLKLFEVQ